jgi:hypothetical protein
MGNIIEFGIKIPKYEFKVLNEREARASAGIMFLLGLLSLFSVYVFRTIVWAELFSITFILEFIIRIFINPKYAPYMILASIFVSNQTPEWVEAKPKKFAWFLGLLLGAYMGYFIFFNLVSSLRFGICILCLVLLFLESAFGICLGCIIYKKINLQLHKCPGGICEVKDKINNTKKYMQVLSYILLFFLLYLFLLNYKYDVAEVDVIYQVIKQ